MKLACYIVEDLMSNYIEGLLSEESARDVQEHLSSCQECSRMHQRMTATVPQQVFMEQPWQNTEAQEQRKKNLEKTSYLRKYKKVLTIVGVTALVGIVAFCILIVVLFVLLFIPEKKVVKDITEYESVLGIDGEYKEHYDQYNDIFPDEIPASAEVEEFYYEYYNPWDANYLGYLTYSCDAGDYEAEYDRLHQLDSSTDYEVYGIEDFPYELCAVYADSNYGVIYALTDEQKQQFIYVELKLANYFTDIDYEKIIDSKYLPEGFNAKKGNEVRQRFDQSMEF